MPIKKPTIEFESDQKAKITYKTDKGLVKVTFFQSWEHSQSYMADHNSCYLNAIVESKSRFGLKYKEVAKAYQEVYSSYSDGYHNVSSFSGSYDFFKNMEEKQITHENPEIAKLIEYAQKDVVNKIPEERSRIAQAKALEEAKNNEEKRLEEERKNNQIKKENNFVASFFKSVGKNR